MRRLSLADLKRLRAYEALSSSEKKALDATWTGAWLDSEPTAELLRQWIDRRMRRGANVSSQSSSSIPATRSLRGLAAPKSAPALSRPPLVTTAVAKKAAPATPFGRVDPRQEELIRAQAERSSLFVRDISQVYARFRGIDLDNPLGGVRGFIDTLAVPQGRRGGDPSGVFNYGPGRGLPQSGSWDWEDELLGRTPIRERSRADVGSDPMWQLRETSPGRVDVVYTSTTGRVYGEMVPTGTSTIATARNAEEAISRQTDREGRVTLSVTPANSEWNLLEQQQATEEQVAPTKSSAELARDAQEADRQADAAEAEAAYLSWLADVADDAAVRSIGPAGVDPAKDKYAAETRADADAAADRAAELRKKAAKAREDAEQAKQRQSGTKHSIVPILPFLPPTEAGELIRREQERRRQSIDRKHEHGYDPRAANIAEGSSDTVVSAGARRKDTGVVDPPKPDTRDPRLGAGDALPKRPDHVSRPAGEHDVRDERTGLGRRRPPRLPL